MRNAKKLMLLLLSLALLCGIFAVAALAEEPATEATVVYPDGSTVTVAVGDTIAPKEFVTEGDAKLYYGAGNTLFKDDATEGWVFTVDGVALTDMTVTDAMAGKKIIAGGASKVYFISYEELTTGTTRVFHLTDDVLDYFTGNNKGDEGNGIHTGATAYSELAKASVTNKLTVKLYNDVTANAMTFCLGTDSGSANKPVYFDLNGHNVTLGKTQGGEKGIDGIDLYLYSSQPGAHFTCTASVFFNPDDQTNFRLGDDGSGAFVDNISFHVNTIYPSTVYGQGQAVIGGHWYQLPGATTPLFSFARRIGAIKNAKFYANDGVAILHDPANDGGDIAKGNTAIDNCEFYSFGTSPLAALANGATPKFTNCKFYNVTIPEAGVNVADESNTLDLTATVKTVTFADGTTARYFADSLEEAKAFVESHPKAAPTQDAKYVGEDYMVRTNPVAVFAYDEAFNATVTVGGEYDAKVYFAVELSTGEVIYYTNAASVGKDFKAYMQAMNAAGSTLVLYSDISTQGFGVNGKAGKIYRLDLNGYTLQITSANTDANAMDIYHSAFYLYSSREGGVLDASAVGDLFRTNDAWYGSDHNYGIAYFGESENSGSAYGKNLTVYCRQINPSTMYGDRVTFNGGTYVQSAGSAATYFLQMGRTGSGTSQVQDTKNCTFVLTNPTTKPLHLRSSADARAFTNCTFISPNNAGGVALNAYAGIETDAKKFTFKNCSFVNVQPYLGSAYVIYDNSAFGTTGAYTMADLDITDAAQYLAHGANVKTIAANGETYVLDGTLVADSSAALKLTHEGLGTDYWAIGATVSVALDEIVKIEGDKLLSGAYYDYSAIDAIEGGVVTKAGEATAPISFSLSKDLAFKYVDASGNVFGVTYEECGSSAAGVGNKFYELFGMAASAYEITMYKDMEIARSIPFGPLVKSQDSTHNRDYYNSFANGNIVWDLNGTTVTIAENVTDIVNLSAANFALATPNEQNQFRGAIFAFEASANPNSFGLILKSSAAGGQIVNESSTPIFGIGEGKKSHITIYGDNLTVTSPNALIFSTTESYADGESQKIIGGTYISGSSSGVFKLSRTALVDGATLISTNPSANQVILLDGYRDGTITVKNTTFVSAKVGAAAIGASTKYNLALDGCSFLNAKPAADGTFAKLTYTYDGAFVASNAEDLALIYAAAPEGKVVAYASVSVNGKAYKVCGYYAAAELVTVQIPLAGTTELWLAGSTFISDATNADISVVEKDGVYYYLSNPVWTGKIDGATVDEILAPENAGETVVLDVEGELEKLYFVREVAGVKTYYYGDVEKVNAEIVAVLAKMGGVSSTITMMNNFALTATSSDGVQIVNAGGKTHIIDLNGFTLSFTHKDISYSLKFQNGHTFIYSSKEGGVLDASAAKSLLMTDSAGNAYFGEPANDGSATYGKNLTVICEVLFSRLYSNNAAFIGGTYKQAEGYVGERFIDVDEGPVPTFRNSTFIVKAVTKGIVRTVSGTYTNCIFIAEDASNLLAKHGTKDTSATFVDCYFYNVIPNVIEGLPVTYTNCHFNTTAALEGGFVAFGGEKVTLNVNGVDYVFGAAFVENAALIDWGFGIKEYWAIGATASRADAVIDGYFTYGFESFVVEGDAAPKATLKAIADGALQMSLTLQDKIGVNLFFAEALADAIVKFGGAEIALADLEVKDGFYKLSTAIAPNLANLDYDVTVVIGENEHVITLSVGTYAEKILASEEFANVHKLTYAMVEYVRAMANDADFLADVDAPAGYEAQLPGEAAYEKGENTLLTGLRFNLSGTIALEIKGAAAKGMEVTLVLANGRTEVATVDENGSAIFVGLYVNDFAGEMEITVGEEVYSYSIENYYNALDAVDSQEAIAALYNYAQYAAAYVELLQNAD